MSDAVTEDLPTDAPTDAPTGDALGDADLQARLAGPDGQRERERLLDHLQALDRQLSARAALAAPAATHSQIAAAQVAVRAAIDTLNRLALSGRAGVEGPLLNRNTFYPGDPP
jgi:hypothetical protein